MANLTLTRQWVENIYQLETSDPVMGGPDGIDNRQAKELGARTNYLKDQVDGINKARTGYAPIANPAFTGVPTAPTARAGTNNIQIATTEFVQTRIAALVGSAPATLDTLEELSRALAGDANLKQTLLTEIGKKANEADFNNLRDLFIGVPIPYPLQAVPTGCLAMNGQRFNTSRYPKLAQKYPSGQLPDLRGEFIRGWGNGRDVDVGRGLLSTQGDAIRNISGWVDGQVGFGSVGSNGLFSVANNADSPASTTGYKGNHRLEFDASRVVPTASENRPRNIAFNYICLAA